jgi:hypothetical protein
MLASGQDSKIDEKRNISLVAEIDLAIAIRFEIGFA